MDKIKNICGMAYFTKYRHSKRPAPGAECYKIVTLINGFMAQNTHNWWLLGEPVKRILVICVLIFGVCQAANADVWKWVDSGGKTHFVSTMKPIYTWVDEFDKVHYADKPEHEDAIAVQIVWHAKGSVDDVAESGDEPKVDEFAFPGETEEQRVARKQAESYYCQRATEIYESYVNAPQLYRTDDDGEREFLSKSDVAKTIADTQAKKEELCK